MAISGSDEQIFSAQSLDRGFFCFVVGDGSLLERLHLCLDLVDFFVVFWSFCFCARPSVVEMVDVGGIGILPGKSAPSCTLGHIFAVVAAQGVFGTYTLRARDGMEASWG